MSKDVNEHWSDKLNACSDAVVWAKKHSTPSEAWNSCERGDWLLWVSCRQDIDRKLLVKAACHCAMLSLKYLPKDEHRPRIAIETALKWVDGGASLKEVRTAAYSASAAAHAAHDAYDADAAATYSAYAAAAYSDYASAYAAYTAYTADADAAATYSASAAAYSASAYAAATYSAYASAARIETLKKCAVIVRGIIKFEDLEFKWRK